MKTLARSSVALGLMGLVALLAQAAAASHWCGQTTITFRPADPVAQRATTFAVGVQSNGVDNTQLYSVEVKFSWEGAYRNISSATILAGQSHTFTVAATPPSAGAYTAQVRLTGTSSGDIFRETTQCSATYNLTAREPGLPGLEPWALLVAGGVAAAAARVGRRP